MINWKRLSERTSKQLDKDFGVMTDEARDVIARWLANFEGWRIGEAEWEDRHRKVLDAGAAAVRVAEQEAAVQARAEADAKWATELGKLLADGEQVAEQRGAEREREACVLLMEDMREAECADAIRARGKQQEPASAERPPAREVLSAAIQETLALGLKPEGSLFASKLLAALAAAGYPVQAGPALVEALEAAPVRPDASEDIYGIRQWFASYRDWKFKAEAALALAKQEPAP